MEAKSNVDCIIKYMKEHETAWPCDISLDLEIAFGEVMEITRQLVEKGVLGVVERNI